MRKSGFGEKARRHSFLLQTGFLFFHLSITESPLRPSTLPETGGFRGDTPDSLRINPPALRHDFTQALYSIYQPHFGFLCSFYISRKIYGFAKSA